MNPRFEREKPPYQTPDVLLIWDPAERETYYDVPRDSWCRFRKSFTLTGTPDDASVLIFADTRYLLFVNGREVAVGPCRSDPRFLYYDVVPIAPYLRRGKNTVAVLVLYYGYGTGQSISRVPALGAEITVKTGSQTLRIPTGRDWRCAKMTAHDPEAPRVNGCKGRIEIFDNRRYEAAWTDPDFDDAGWSPCHERDPLWSPYWNWQPRPVAMLTRRTAKADSVISRGVGPKAGDVPTDHLHVKIMEELKEADFVPVSERLPAAVPAGDPVFLTVDFGGIKVGTLTVEAAGRDGTVIDAVYAETLFDGKPRFDGVSYRPISRFILKEGENRLPVFFGYEAFRYVTFIVRGQSETVLRRVTVNVREYPYERRASFRCDNEDMNRLWKISTHTLEISTQDGFLDSPSREQQQWMGDGRYQAIFTAYYAGDTAMGEKLLTQIAQSQDYEGMTASRYPDANHNLAPIPAYCLQWISAFTDHDRFTGNTAFLARHYPGILNGIRWFSAFERDDGLLTDLPYWNYCDTGVSADGRQGDFYRGGATAFHNLMYAEAMASVIRCAGRLGDREAAAFFTAKRKRLVDAIRTVFWSEADGVYRDCVKDGDLSSSTSEVVNAMAILQAEDDPGRRTSILDRVFRPETKRPDIVEASVYAMPLLARALKALGEEGLSVRLFLERYREMIRSGSDTTWEYWWLSRTDEAGNVSFGSACHAWGASAILLIAENVLGLTPEALRRPETVDRGAVPPSVRAILGQITAEFPLMTGGSFVTY